MFLRLWIMHAYGCGQLASGSCVGLGLENKSFVLVCAYGCGIRFMVLALVHGWVWKMDVWFWCCLVLDLWFWCWLTAVKNSLELVYGCGKHAHGSKFALWLWKTDSWFWCRLVVVEDKVIVLVLVYVCEVHYREAPDGPQKPS